MGMFNWATRQPPSTLSSTRAGGTHKNIRRSGDDLILSESDFQLNWAFEAQKWLENVISDFLTCLAKFLDNIYIIDTIYCLDIIETSIDVINDEQINDDVNNVNDFDHIYQTRQLTELINGSYDRRRFQDQYLFWLLVTKAS